MWFPKQRMRFARSVDGKSSEKGFLVLDIKSLDLEGGPRPRRPGERRRPPRPRAARRIAASLTCALGL
jgi:hypothetical protein